MEPKLSFKIALVGRRVDKAVLVKASVYDEPIYEIDKIELHTKIELFLNDELNEVHFLKEMDENTLKKQVELYIEQHTNDSPK